MNSFIKSLLFPEMEEMSVTEEGDTIKDMMVLENPSEKIYQHIDGIFQIIHFCTYE